MLHNWKLFPVLCLLSSVSTSRCSDLNPSLPPVAVTKQKCFHIYRLRTVSSYLPVTCLDSSYWSATCSLHVDPLRVLPSYWFFTCSIRIDPLRSVSSYWSVRCCISSYRYVLLRIDSLHAFSSHLFATYCVSSLQVLQPRAFTWKVWRTIWKLSNVTPVYKITFLSTYEIKHTFLLGNKDVVPSHVRSAEEFK